MRAMELIIVFDMASTQTTTIICERTVDGDLGLMSLISSIYIHVHIIFHTFLLCSY